MEGADRKARGASDLGVRAASAVVMLAVAGHGAVARRRLA